MEHIPGFSTCTSLCQGTPGPPLPIHPLLPYSVTPFFPLHRLTLLRPLKPRDLGHIFGYNLGHIFGHPHLFKLGFPTILFFSILWAFAFIFGLFATGFIWDCFQAVTSWLKILGTPIFTYGSALCSELLPKWLVLQILTGLSMLSQVAPSYSL